MGAFTDLETTTTYFGPQQTYLDSIKSDYSAATTPLILKDEAKAVLKLDLQEKLGLLPSDTDDMSTLDEIVTAQADRMKRILALKQMEMVYEDKNEGEGSTSYALWKHYRDAYANEKAGFAGLIRKQGTVTVRSVGIYR